ncbi:MAG: cellulose binding domain-containing protein [Pseudomonadota bacterium]
MKHNNKSQGFWLARFLLSAVLFCGGGAYAAQCQYIVTDDWGGGFGATMRITNDGASTINGWSVSWNYTDGSRRTSGWNATVSGSNPYTATPLSWNTSIAPNSSVEFGLQGSNGGSKAQVPVISGAVCSSLVATSSRAASSATVNFSSKATASSIPASRFSSSSVVVARSSTPLSNSSISGVNSQQCNWYGTTTPVCANTTNGWGYEGGKSCVAASTCSAQPAPYGIVGATNTSKSVSSARVSSSPGSILPSSRYSSRISVSSAKSSSSAASISGCDGYATRYWDCCKPHCGWSANLPSGVSALPSCSATNTQLGDITAGSSCNGGNAHMCWGLTPFAVSDKLAYGYAATSNGDVCGRCYQLQFTGASHNSAGDPGSSALAGKTMIVQATNIGYDVSGGQFDILVPGGGVGAFNACSAQWGVSNAELGAQYGGLLAACKQELGYNASLASYKACLTNRCDNVFGTRGLTELQKGCRWYADWFEAADNPALKYKEVACPSELTSRSGMNRGGLNDIKNTCN